MCIDLVMFIQKYSVEQKKSIKKKKKFLTQGNPKHLYSETAINISFEPKTRNTEEKRKTWLKRWKIIRQVYVYKVCCS